MTPGRRWVLWHGTSAVVHNNNDGDSPLHILWCCPSMIYAVFLCDNYFYSSLSYDFQHRVVMVEMVKPWYLATLDVWRGHWHIAIYTRSFCFLCERCVDCGYSVKNVDYYWWEDHDCWPHLTFKELFQCCQVWSRLQLFKQLILCKLCSQPTNPLACI